MCHAYRLVLSQVKEAVEGLLKDGRVGNVLDGHALQTVKFVCKDPHPADALNSAPDALVSSVQRRVEDRVGAVDHHDD